MYVTPMVTYRAAAHTNTFPVFLFKRKVWQVFDMKLDSSPAFPVCYVSVGV